MARFTPAEFKNLLARDLSGAIMPIEATSSEPHAERDLHKKVQANLLATEDAVVRPEDIARVARYLRDTLGYTLLSNITAVDYLREGVIEIVYHFAHAEGGVITVKVRVPRDEPKLPTLTEEWPGADFQEREAYDLYGVVFLGHANLRRIYMWDEFEGFPMRKDFPKQGDKYLGSAE